MLQILDCFLRTTTQRIIGLSFADLNFKTDSLTNRARNSRHGNNENVNSFSKLFIFLTLLTFFVYARALFFPVLGIDSMTYHLSNGHGDMYFEMARGMWTFAGINQLVPGPLVTPLISTLAFLLSIVSMVFLVVVFWSGPCLDWKAYTVGAIMVLFPYWTSMAYFNYHHYPYSVCIMGGVMSIIIPWHKGGIWRWLLSIVCIVLGSSAYQGSFSIGTGLFGATLLVAVINKWHNKPDARCTWKSLLRVGLVQLSGGISYLLIHKLLLYITKIESLSHGYIIDITMNLSRLLDNLSVVIPGSPVLLPPQASWFLAVALAIICVQLICFQGKNKSAPSSNAPLLNTSSNAYPNLASPSANPSTSNANPSTSPSICSSFPSPASPYILLWLIPAAMLAMLAPIALSIIQPIKLPARSVVGVVFVWGAVFWLAAHLSGKCIKKLLLGTTGLLCLFFALRINNLWQIQALTTEADVSDARGMLKDLYDLPEFANAPKPLDVSFVGCLADDARSWKPDYDSIFGASQFACFGVNSTWPAHASAALRFVGGHIRAIPTETYDLEAVATRKPWPASESVFWNGDHAVIWLGPAQRKVSTMQERIQRIAEAMQINSISISKNSSMPSSPSKLLELVHSGSGPWDGTKLRHTLGFVDATTPLPDNPKYLKVIGWAFDVNYKVQPPYVALLNCENQIVGLAATGIYRPDVFAKVATDANYSGFEGFTLAEEKICSLKY